jgi:hypothetical protein
MVNRGFAWARERACSARSCSSSSPARYAVLAGLVLLLSLQAAASSAATCLAVLRLARTGHALGQLRHGRPTPRAPTPSPMMREMQRATDAVAARLEAEHGAWPVVHVLTEIGGNTGRGLARAENRSPDHVGSITIELIDPDLRPYSAFEFTALLQDEVARHPLLDDISFRSFGMGPGGDRSRSVLFGADSATLKDAAEALKTQLAPWPEITGLEDSLAFDKEETVLELTPQGRALGFSAEGWRASCASG